MLTNNATEDKKKEFKEKDEKVLMQLIMCVGNLGPSKQYSSSQSHQEKKDSIKCHRCGGLGHITRNCKVNESGT